MYKKALILVLTAAFLTGCGSFKRLSINNYPDIKIGFTTQNFIKAKPVSIETSKQLISYAKDNGYSWIELRDPDASLTFSECEQIAAFAKTNRIEVIYSSQRGLLDGDFMDVFGKALTNSTAFDGPKYVRVLAAGSEYPPNTPKLGWTKQEFEKAVKIAEKAAQMAAQYGFKIAVENSNGDIDGKDKPYYGFAELLDNTCENVCWQFDTANFFWVPQAKITAEKAEAFLRKYAHRLSYLHLKSASNGKALPVLADNPLKFDTIFPILKNADCNYIAIELDVVDDENLVYENQAKSLEYLLSKDL